VPLLKSATRKPLRASSSPTALSLTATASTPCSLTQARLDWIVSEGQVWQRVWVPAFLRWLYAVGEEVAGLKQAFHDTPEGWTPEQWTQAQVRRVRLEAQYEAIQETLQRRERRQPKTPERRLRLLCGGSSSTPGRSPSTATLAGALDPFASE
jgi:hypothetical protein